MRGATDLLASWTAAAGALGASGDVTGTGRRVLERYAEPHRAYHDIRHLREVVSAVRLLSPYAATPAAVMVAAWLHDAVYDPRRADNEERSAGLARAALEELGVSPPAVMEVSRLVLLTATHDPRPDDRNGAVLCDADLAVLARPTAGYVAYVSDVRREYAHVPADAFASGRTAVLRRLLGRDPLFSTDAARDRWERRARQNLTAELADLLGGA
ncbi:MAG: metal-dependent phosphohydrolase [Actinomycetota bacterium]|nr:metal-dependent phosphohydrolase [Actinomycetota bacterium]